MNPHLRKILDILDQANGLGSEEKSRIRESVDSAEEQLLSLQQEQKIEESLERVRAITLTMKQPNDVLDVCKVMFHELQSLGFNDDPLKTAPIIFPA